MNKIVSFARRLLRIPARLLVSTASRVQDFKVIDRMWTSEKLELLFGFYEIETTRFFKKNIKKGMTVVDVGANIGYFTRMFSKLVGPEGKVYAFEPDLENFEVVKENIKNFPNVTLYPYAVSDQEGEATWHHMVGAAGSHSLIYDPTDTKKNVEYRKVKTVTLDNLIPEKINFIKIDAEGVEDLVLRGMKRHLQEGSTWAAFEYTKGYEEDLVHELKQSGTVYGLSLWGDTVPFEQARYILAGRKLDKSVEVPGSLTNLVYHPKDL